MSTYDVAGYVCAVGGICHLHAWTLNLISAEGKRSACVCSCSQAATATHLPELLASLDKSMGVLHDVLDMRWVDTLLFSLAAVFDAVLCL